MVIYYYRLINVCALSFCKCQAKLRDKNQKKGQLFEKELHAHILISFAFNVW